MRCSSFLILAVATAASTVDAWCVPWKDGGTLQLCKQQGKRNCLGVSSDDTCINLIGGPFVSGWAGGHYQCTIYAGSGCTGTRAMVDREGWSKFDFNAWSMRCPCV